MTKIFLLVTNKPQSMWVKTVALAVETLGGLQTAGEKEVWQDIGCAPYDMVIIDATAMKEVTLLVTQIHKIRPQVPIVVAAHSRTWRRAHEVIKAGATDYILKTLSNEALRAVLISLLNDIVPSTTKAPVAKATILFADNDPEFLITTKEFFERAGYTIILASNPEETKRKLEVGGIDLAILDIRLENDDDDNDISGLLLAKQVARTVPKILVTSYPSYRYVREVLRPQFDGLQVAKDFVAREDGLLALLQTAEDILKSVETEEQGKFPKRKLFLAHGHDTIAKDTVVAFLESIGLQPIVLADKADRGDTIIEKFERHSKDTSFAIALFTSDDFGYSKADPTLVKPRARQNVIFELGYFLAKLGRRRVRVLYREGVEIPSNILGLLYIKLDEQGKWKEYLIRELEDAGLSITD
jgi:predicted nucleotide-binding protein/DNA-binding response OmpR family regulator